VGWLASVGPASALGDGWAVFAPELHLSDRMSVFCEVDPTVPLAGGRSEVTFVPGVGASFDAEGAHSASLGVGVLPGPSAGWNVGLAWTSTFSMGRRSPTIVAEDDTEAAPASP
jgi:hypothetical protein